MAKKDYQETEMSVRAKEILNKIAEPTSHLETIVKSLRFDSYYREKVNNPDGSLNIEKAYEMLGVEDQLLVLLKKCVEWNLTEEQAHDLIKYRYRQCYGPGKGRQLGLHGGMHITMSEYPKWCQDIGITPDPNFSDWGDKEKAKESIEKGMRKLEDELGIK